MCYSLGMSDTLTVRWGRDGAALADRLRAVASVTRRPLSDYIRSGVESNIEEWEEEAEALKVLERVRSGKEKVYSPDQVRAKFGWQPPSAERMAELLEMVE